MTLILDDKENTFLIKILTRAKGTVNYLAPETLEAEEVNDDD